MTSVVWFRRDLRLADHPALTEAAQAGPVVALFVSDPALAGPSGAPRRAFLSRCLDALDASTGGRLVVRVGDPATVVPAAAAEVGAPATCSSPPTSASTGVAATTTWRVPSAPPAAASCGWDRPTPSSPARCSPATAARSGSSPPFYRAWRDHGRPGPLPRPPALAWADGARSDGPVPEPPANGRPAAGRRGRRCGPPRRVPGRAGARLHTLRDVPAAGATTRLSPYLKYGCISPRQVLARFGRSKAAEKLRSELAWREFCADVLWHRPESAWCALQEPMAALRVDDGDEADERFEAWASGRTGYPLVDAGMRQLLAEAWMPNRVRMVTASFLVKDLHLDWTRGARWFLRHLVDGDLASNNAGWQWVAGTGTDPAPYFRVFNPVAQARRHDPAGDYVRRWIPELDGVAPPEVFEPWRTLAGPAGGYPPPVVDHAAERAEALARYAEVRRGA